MQKTLVNKIGDEVTRLNLAANRIRSTNLLETYSQLMPKDPKVGSSLEQED